MSRSVRVHSLSTSPYLIRYIDPERGPRIPGAGVVEAVARVVPALPAPLALVVPVGGAAVAGVGRLVMDSGRVKVLCGTALATAMMN